MQLHPPFALKPTFPLDDSEIRRRTGLRKFFHPLSLGALCGGALLGLATGAGAIQFLIVLGAIGTGLYYYWKKNGTRLESKVIRELIAESNRAQDLKLSAIVDWFRARGLHHYAVPLGKFLLLKQRIEASLHDDGVLTPAKTQIDQLVDHICAGVCRQFSRVSHLDVEIGRRLVSRDREKVAELEAQRSELLQQIMHAYDTIYETQSTILDLETAHHGLAPGAPTPSKATPPPLPRLNKVIDQLKEENEISRRVQERLHIDAAKSGDPDYGAFDDLLEAE